METNIDDLMKEYRILERTQEMYKNTREEMILKNAKKDAIKSIEEEIEGIDSRKVLLIKAINALSNKNNEEYAEVAKEIYGEDVAPDIFEKIQEFINASDEKKKLEGKPIPSRKRTKKTNQTEIPLDATPIKTNHFLVHFPDEYGIEPYMIESCAEYETNTLSIVIREFENQYPILPIRLINMEKDTFTITIDTLSSGNKVYYTTIYEGCKLVKEDIGKPYNTYINSQVRTYNLLFSVENISYLTPTTDETTYQENNK